MTDHDGVTDLRALADWFKRIPVGATTRIESDFTEDLAHMLKSAADEIERLRAERDELRGQRNQLRAEVVDRALGIKHPVCWDLNSPSRKRCEKYARLRGWHDLWDTVNEQERLLREEATQ